MNVKELMATTCIEEYKRRGNLANDIDEALKDRPIWLKVAIKRIERRIYKRAKLGYVNKYVYWPRLTVALTRFRVATVLTYLIDNGYGAFLEGNGEVYITWEGYLDSSNKPTMYRMVGLEREFGAWINRDTELSKVYKTILG